MTIRKNEFQAIANILKPYIIVDYDSLPSILTQKIADDLCIYFRQNNPAFNKEKFLKACGVYRS